MPYLRVGDPVPEKGRGSKLTRLQWQFVEAYTDPNGKGFKSPTNAIKLTDYKTDNPNKMGMFLMQHPLVLKEIKTIEDARRERLDLTADYVLHKLIQMVEETSKDNDRIRALELLGKNLGLFKERQEISGPDGEAIKYEEKVREDAADFARTMARLAQRGKDPALKDVSTK